MKPIKYVFTIKHKNLRKNLEWTTAQGYDILLKDMEDSHVINTCLYLCKKQKALDEFSLPYPEINGKIITSWIEIFKNEIEFRRIK